jgi:hypothetical protein
MRVEDAPWQRGRGAVIHACQTTGDTPKSGGNRNHRREQICSRRKRHPCTFRVEECSDHGAKQAAEERQAAFPYGEDPPRLAYVRERVVLNDVVQASSDKRSQEGR